jgi:hypothetical protein
MITIKHGSQVKGKYRIATFGWSKANVWNRNGADKTALMTIFKSKPRQRKFHHNNNRLFFTTPFLKQIKYTIGAVMPDSISKFLPAKVISSGMNL